jgi:hypothetical protein
MKQDTEGGERSRAQEWEHCAREGGNEGARRREHNTRRGAGNNRRKHGARGEVRCKM